MSAVASYTAAVVVVSDGVSAGEREDSSGALARKLLEELGFVCRCVVVVPDDREEIAATLIGLADEGVSLIVTSGGTGFGVRDVTPEATSDVLERLAPGMAEVVRAASPAPYGMLSRATAGTRQNTVIVNLPGSCGGVRDGLRVLASGLVHAVELSLGADTGHPEPDEVHGGHSTTAHSRSSLC